MIVLATFLEALGGGEPSSLAEQLLREFGSISGVLGASRWHLRRSMPRQLAAAVAASREIMRVSLAEIVADRPLIIGSDGLMKYLRMEVGFFEHERMIALYVDHSCRLIKIVNLQEGASDGMFVDTQRILREGMALGAAGFILVHNHPSGDPRPSRADRSLTDGLSRLSRELQMPLIDHLIVAREKVWSYGKDRLADGSEPWTGGDIPGVPVDG